MAKGCLAQYVGHVGSFAKNRFRFLLSLLLFSLLFGRLTFAGIAIAATAVEDGTNDALRVPTASNDAATVTPAAAPGASPALPIVSTASNSTANAPAGNASALPAPSPRSLATPAPSEKDRQSVLAAVPVPDAATHAGVGKSADGSAEAGVAEQAGQGVAIPPADGSKPSLEASKGGVSSVPVGPTPDAIDARAEANPRPQGLPNVNISWTGYFEALAILCFALAVLLFGLWLFKRLAGGSRFLRQDGAALKIESRLALGPKKWIFIVRYRERQLVVGMTDHQISLLAEYALEDTPDAPLPPQDVFGTFLAQEEQHTNYQA